MSLLRSTATQLVAQLNAGQVSSVEITQACLDQIERHDPDVKAFLRVDPPAALAAAREIDARRARGQKLGRLAGLPVAIKDLLCTQGETTTCGSKMLEHFKPPYDATVVARLRAADAVLIGKTNMDEFAMGGSNENSAFFATRNPWDLQRIPGGSSGGSAACVAARMAPLAIGTDTGGSIRQPAGLCGVTGLKPTYGRVSRFGLVAFASSLDQIGPMARTAEDAALLLEVLAGHDPSDSTSVDRPVPPYSQTVGKPLTGLRLGLVREHFGPGLDGEVERAVREAMNVYQSLGATVREVSMRHSKYAVATYYIIAPCEASSNLARYDGVHYGHRTDRAAMAAELEGERLTLAAAGREDDLENPLVRLYRRSRAEGFGTEVKRRIMLGTYALSAGYYDAYYLKALKVRRLIRRDYDEAFRDVDLIAGPVTTAPAFKVGEKSADPLAMYLVDLYTVSANLAGVGGIAFPCGLSSGGLPIGLQLQAPPFEEERMLRAAHMFQQATDWHTRTGGVLNLVFGVRFSVFGFRCSVDTLKQAASAPVPMSEVATIPCGRLRLAFERRGDRVGHTVFLQHEGVAIALLRSVEGTAEEDWPASPPLRDFHLAARDGGDGQVAFLVGMAGRSHWSASIDADPVGEQITFDLACRLKQPPDQLGATYQLLGPPWRVAADGTRAVLDSRLIPVRLALVPLDATLRLDAERLILAPRPPLADPKYPLTARWCFRLEVEE